MAKYYTPAKISENIRETPEGFLVCLGVPIARTGWQEYGQGECPLEVGDDGICHVYRSSDEVFRPQTIASFEGKAITIKHPADFVVPDNWSYLAKGIVQNVRRGKELDDDGEESLFADLLITEALAIQLVKNGLREVSCGYEAEYEQTEVGKGRQTNIVGNHLALVEQGRAGSSYAINDAKRGEETVSPKMIEKLKAKFGVKAVDEAMAEGKEEKSKDEKGYDELVKVVKDLSDKIDSMGKGKDEEKPAEKKPKAKEDEESSDEDADEEEKSEDDEEEGMKLEERMKALEAAVAKLLEKSSDESSEEEEKSEDEDEEEESAEDEDDMSGDASIEGEEGEQSEKKTGDALMLSRAEILSPGIKKTKGTDIRVEALKSAYQSKDGKAIINALTGGKKPTFDAKGADALFVAASEVLKAKRGTGLEKTKDGKGFAVDANAKNEPMTPEKMNEIHAAHWARK